MKLTPTHSLNSFLFFNSQLQPKIYLTIKHSLFNNQPVVIFSCTDTLLFIINQADALIDDAGMIIFILSLREMSHCLRIYTNVYYISLEARDRVFRLGAKSLLIGKGRQVDWMKMSVKQITRNICTVLQAGK